MSGRTLFHEPTDMSDADEGSERLHELAIDIDAWLHAIATTSKKACN